MLRGRAWSGEAAIERVEVSTDGGPALASRPTLVGANDPSVLGRAGSCPGRPVGRVPTTCVVRATDTNGRRQPERAPDNDDGYLFGAAVRLPGRRGTAGRTG